MSQPDASSLAGPTVVAIDAVTPPSPSMAHPSSPAASHPAASYHADSDSLRYWVVVTGQAAIGASVSRSVLHHRFKGAVDGSDALVVYAAHRAELEDAVRRRVALGSREPVIVRENDLPPPNRR
jgi:Protein of unknown function (DUF1488)